LSIKAGAQTENQNFLIPEKCYFGSFKPVQKGENEKQNACINVTNIKGRFLYLFSSHFVYELE